MINIDAVYQTVLAIANIEQRGQITPSDFNYYARQAQLDIFNQNLFDLAFHLNSGKSTPDIVNTAMQRVEVFQKHDNIVSMSGNNTFTLPDDLFELKDVYYLDATNKRVEVEKVSSNDIFRIQNSAKMAPSLNYPKYIRLQNNLEVYPEEITTNISIFYLKTPDVPKWGYVGGDTPIYNSDTSVNFELHSSQHAQLVSAILRMAGIALREPDLINYGNLDLGEDKQAEKA